MIDIADLQAFLEKIQGGTIPVDLLKIGQSHYAQYANAGKFIQPTQTFSSYLYLYACTKIVDDSKKNGRKFIFIPTIVFDNRTKKSEQVFQRREAKTHNPLQALHTTLYSDE